MLWTVSHARLRATFRPPAPADDECSSSVDGWHFARLIPLSLSLSHHRRKTSLSQETDNLYASSSSWLHGGRSTSPEHLAAAAISPELIPRTVRQVPRGRGGCHRACADNGSASAAAASPSRHVVDPASAAGLLDRGQHRSKSAVLFIIQTSVLETI